MCLQKEEEEEEEDPSAVNTIILSYVGYILWLRHVLAALHGHCQILKIF